jgi:hypothetical protein
VFGPPKNDGSYVKENKGDLHGVGAGRCRPVTGPHFMAAFLKLLDELRITLHGRVGPLGNQDSLRAGRRDFGV